MVSFSSSEDVRMQQIRGKITGLEGDLEHLFGYVDSLPGAEQREARAALRRGAAPPGEGGGPEAGGPV